MPGVLKCQPKGNSPIIELNPLNDITPFLNSDTENCVKFVLGRTGKCFGNQQIDVKVKLIYNNSWLPTSYCKTTFTNKCGIFKVNIPANVSDISVKVTTIDCNKCSVFFATGASPTPLSYLTGQELRRFAMMKFACVLTNNCCARDSELVNKDQNGPHRSSRANAMAIVAAFDAYNSIVQVYNGYLGLPVANPNSSVEAAIIQAAVVVLLQLYPQQSEILANTLVDALALIPNGAAKTNGIAAGNLAATTMLELRANDNAGPPGTPEQVIGTDPGQYVEGLPSEPRVWKKDPISNVPIAMGSKWAQVTPFVIQSADQFRLNGTVPDFPDLTSNEYTLAYNEVKSLGGDGITTPTVRDIDATEIGVFWGYDGAKSLCTPPRLYNQILDEIAMQMEAGPLEYGRLVAQLNLALADAGISAWECKYHFKIARPITAIREAVDDGNPDTVADPTYTPYGAPASNSIGPNFTPAFPAYVSGHATFGASLFQLLRTRYTDDINFTFLSEELNGITKDNEGNVRPAKPRTYMRLSQAELENAQSRIYLGIHWNQDKVYGIKLGNAIADYIVENTYQPL
jgi:hypothetical protein